MNFDVSTDDKNKCGVYIIINTINGKNYIGSTISTFHVRFRKHVSELNKNNHHSNILQKAYIKYGEQNFVFKILKILPNKDEKKIRNVEEKYMKIYTSDYNICTKPSRGGHPNLNRKLTKTWKDKIAYKSSLYKHNEKTLKLVTNNNKNNSCELVFSKNNTKIKFKSWVSAAEHFNCDTTTLKKVYAVNGKFRGYLIEKLTTQRSSILVFFKNRKILFRSLNSCDRFLNRWRGYTSTKTLRNELLLDKYKYKIYKDIV